MSRIGFHGTSKRHRASLEKGLKEVQSEWDPASGGELGQGFYVASSEKGAITYGFGAASARINDGRATADDRFVDVWAVYCSHDLSLMPHMAVSPSQTWANFPRAYAENFHFVYLSNDPGFAPPLDPPRPATKEEIAGITQIKFNPGVFAFGVLTLAFSRTISVQEAEDLVFS